MQTQNTSKRFKANVEEIQAYIKDKSLAPVIRAVYTRTAFQIPGDDRIRVSLDTDLALIREDDLDTDRPCRDPGDWHRSDIDKDQLEFPFSSIKKGEIDRFKHAMSWRSKSRIPNILATILGWQT